MKTAFENRHAYWKNKSSKQHASLEDVLKYQDATVALKQLQEILGESRETLDQDAEKQFGSESLISSSLKLSPSIDASSSVCDLDFLDETATCASAPSCPCSHQHQHRHSHRCHDEQVFRQPWFMEVSNSYRTHSSMDLGSGELDYSVNNRPAISRALSFQEEVSVLRNHPPAHTHHCHTQNTLQAHWPEWQEPHTDFSKQQINIPDDSVSESFKCFEFVYFDDETGGEPVHASFAPSPPVQPMKIDSPKNESPKTESPKTENVTTPHSNCSGSGNQDNLKDRCGIDRRSSFPISKMDRKPPTPGLTLVEQLKMDGALMESIAKKHKRGYYKCTHCPNTFSNIFEYAAHMDEYEIKRAYKCPFPLCPWKILGLPRRADLRRHCAIQHKNELPQELKDQLNLNDEAYPALKCPHQYCEKVFHRRDAFNRHIAIVHEKLNSRFNRRLFQTLADCPYDKENDRLKYVRLKMKGKKQQALLQHPQHPQRQLGNPHE